MNCQECVYFKKGKTFKNKGRGSKEYITFFVSCTYTKRLVSKCIWIVYHFNVDTLRENKMKEKECFPQKKDGTIDMCEVMKENAEFSNSVLELSNSVLELTNSKTELESKVTELEKRNCDKWEVGK